MKTDDLKDLIYEAQDHLNEAISLLETYVRETGDSNAEAYLLDHLKIFAGRNHGFLSGDLNLDDLLERIDDRDGEDDEGAADDVDDLPEVKTVGGQLLYLLRNNLGPIRNSYGEPIYATIPTD